MRTCEECIFFERERNGDYKDTLCSHPFIDTGYVDAKQEACEEFKDGRDGLRNLGDSEQTA